MNQPKLEIGIRCNDCQYEGHPRTNSSTIFLIFFLLLCTSIFFLPLIIVALIYMAIAIAKPAQKSCPECKSTNILDLELKAVQDRVKNAEKISENSQKPLENSGN